MKKLALTTLLALASIMLAQETPPPPETAAPAAAVPSKRTIVQNGQTFEFASESKAPNCETQEYVVQGEDLANWSQLLTLQRITLAEAATPADFVAFFNRKTQEEGDAKLEILQQGLAACVFAVHFQKSDRNEEQVMLCMVTKDKKPTILNLIQYAIKPAKLSSDVVTLQLKSWQSRFCTQAATAATR